MTVFQRTRRTARDAARRMERIRRRRAAFDKRCERARYFPANQLMHMYRRTQARWVLQTMIEQRTGLFRKRSVQGDTPSRTRPPATLEPTRPTLWSQVG